MSWILLVNMNKIFIFILNNFKIIIIVILFDNFFLLFGGNKLENVIFLNNVSSKCIFFV